MKLFLALSMAVSVAGHNGLKSPPSRNGNRDSTSKPCPAAAEGYTAYTTKPGATIEAGWSDNHKGDHWLVIVPAADEATLEADGWQDKGAVVGVRGNDGQDKLYAGSITAPTDPGNYVMQWRWGNYRNCVDLVVTAPEVVELTCAANDDVSECHKNHGLQSDCVEKVCVCKEGYVMEGNVCTSVIPLAVDCAFFCTDAVENCRDDASIYDSLDDCYSKCANYPIGELNDKTGNSLNCRFWHLHVEVDTTKHCSHASYSGLDLDHCAGTDYKHGVAVKMTAELASTASTLLELEAYVTTALKEVGVEGAEVVVTDSETNQFVAVVHAASAADAAKVVSSAAAMQTGLATASSDKITASTPLSTPVTAEQTAGTDPKGDLSASNTLSPMGPMAAAGVVLAMAQFM